ncbi:MAG: hypothetical protein RIG82_09640 [Phycisphaeraceae bacterium]
MSDCPVQEPPAAVTTVPEERAQEEGWWTRLYHRWEARLSRLSTRNRFWQKLFSMMFLPLAYRSGIRFLRGDENSFSAILPFRRFNRNWYNAMAGGALLGNAEVAGGMYVFEKCGADYTVVCKHLEYTFRRPCFGPAVYRITPHQDIDELLATGQEFNLTVDMQILQMVTSGDEKERRVGQSVATFHVTPKTQARSRKLKLVTRRDARPESNGQP